MNGHNSAAPNCIKHFHWTIRLFWPVRFDFTIVSTGNNNCIVKPDWPESPHETVVKSNLISQYHPVNQGNPLYNWVQKARKVLTSDTHIRQNALALLRRHGECVVSDQSLIFLFLHKPGFPRYHIWKKHNRVEYLQYISAIDCWEMEKLRTEYLCLRGN